MVSDVSNLETSAWQGGPPRVRIQESNVNLVDQMQSG